MFILLFFAIAYTKFLGQVSVIQSETMKVYLFPHSHDDVGWVKTYMQYYEMNHGVKQIIDSYMNELIADSSKHFSQVEVAFFSIWWNAQNDTMKEIVKKLVSKEQLEFLSGGWCMNDEATAYYEDIIDQMTLGHKFLLENFNYVPTVGWQVDPFGHSNAQAKLSSMMGFNAWFFGRIDLQDRKVRESNKALEFVVHPSSMDHSILTHVNYYGYYSSPQGFDFDVQNPNRQQVNDNNVQRKAEELVQYFKKQSNVYRGKILAHTLGMDFQWSDAKSYFEQMDRVIQVVNKNSVQYNMTIVYGTPQQYINELHEQNITYPHQKEDFFPYQDYPNQYWSGYFTSRSSFKGYVKRLGRYFQQVKQIYSLLKIDGSSRNLLNYENIQKLAEALGTSQHHDAITGTAKQFVNDDYVEMLDSGKAKMDTQMSQILNHLSDNVVDHPHVQCNFNGSHTCDALFNPLQNSQTVLLTLIDTRINNDGIEEFIKLQVPDGILISVVDENKDLVSGEIFCIEKECTLYIPRVVDNSKMIHYYRITKVNSQDFTKVSVVKGEPIGVTNDQLWFSKFKLSYGYYIGDGSGAYLFRPQRGGSKPYSTPVSALEFKGQLFQMVYINSTKTKTWITTSDEKVFYIESFIDSLDIDDRRGKEVIIQIDTKIQNNNIFYTDSSGLEQQKRQVNHRESWNMDVVEPVSSNYFPVNGFIAIVDPKTNEAAALLNDRAQGGTSLKQGQLELMLQRRLLNDDNKGVQELLNEQEVYNQKKVGMRQRMQHTLVFYSTDQPNRVRQLQYQQDLSPLLYFATLREPTTEVSYHLPSNKFENFIEKMDEDNLCKFYIEPWITEREYLVRVHNMREKGVIKLNFPSDIEFVETTLTGNQKLSLWEQKKIKWSDTFNEDTVTYSEDEVGPQQIRTWIVAI